MGGLWMSLRSGVGVDVDAVRAVALQRGLPGDNRAGFDGFGVAVDGAVAVHGLVGAGRADTQELDTQGVGHRVLFSQTQNLIGGILEVGHASQGHAPGLGGGQADVEALRLVVVGDDVLSVGVRLQGRVRQAVQAERVVGAVHCQGCSFNREDATRVGDGRGRRHNIRVAGAGIDEVGVVAHTSEGQVHVGRRQGHNERVEAKCRTER